MICEVNKEKLITYITIGPMIITLFCFLEKKKWHEIDIEIHLFVQVFGLMTKPLVRLLLPSSKHGGILSSEPSIPKHLTAPLLGDSQEDQEADTAPQNIPRPTSLRMLLSIPSHTVHHYWRKFDNGFMRPVFGGRGFVPFVPGSPTE